jgi:WD40 repeat protein
MQWANSVAFSPDGALLVRTNDAGEVAFWNPEAGTRKNDPFQGRHVGALGAACFGPEGKTLAVAGGDGTFPKAQVEVWDVARRKRLASWTLGGCMVWALAISPDGKLLATDGLGQVKLWAMPKP